MLNYWQLLHPRFWISWWKAINFVYYYGPDQAKIVARDIDLLDCLAVATENWFADATVSLPHRYRQLLIQLQQNMSPNQTFFRLVSHKLLAEDLITSFIHYEGHLKKQLPTFQHEKLLWQEWPHVLDSAPSYMQEKIKEFEQDLAMVIKQYPAAYYWSQALKEVRQIEAEHKAGT